MYIHEFPHPRLVVHYHPTREQFTLEQVRFALEQNVHALELDLHLRPQDGQTVCNHDEPTPSSPPLEQVIDLVLAKKGDAATVNDDGCQFFLVLEPKRVSPALFDGILEILRRYAPHFSTSVGKGVAPRGITAVITGEHRSQFHSHFSPDQLNRLCVVEDHDYTEEIVNLADHQTPFQWVALKSGSERGRVNALHAGTDSQLKGRYNVRVWDCRPDDLPLCLASGVDQINCDRDQVQTLKRIIRHQSPRGRAPALAIQGSQALLTWRGRTSNNLYVAVGTVEASGLKFERQIALTHLLTDELLALSPAAALIADGRLLVLYEALSDHRGLRRLWHALSQRLPPRLARLMRSPQSLCGISGRFTSLERFVTFDGCERRLTLPSGATLRGRDPALAVGPVDRVLIVYEGVAGQGLRYVSGTLRPDGELVVEDYPLLEGEVCAGYTPAAAVDQADRVVVVYQGSAAGELLYVSGFIDPSGRIVGRRFPLTQGEACRGSAPSIALDGSGRMVVAYRARRDQRIWYVSGTLDDSGQVTGTTFPLTEDPTRLGSHPTVAFDLQGHLVVLYQELRDHQFRYVHGPLRAGRLVGQERPLSIGMKRC